MTIDEIEKLAREVVIDRKTGSLTFEATKRLARALLAVLPVAHAAEKLRATWAGPACLKEGVDFQEEVDLARAFMDAVDAMRAALDGGGT